MFEEFQKVRIKASGVVGEIIDIANQKGTTVYTVESDTKGPIDGGCGKTWPLYECLEDDLEKVDRQHSA